MEPVTLDYSKLLSFLRQYEIEELEGKRQKGRRLVYDFI